MTDNILELKNITKIYNADTPIFDGINLTLKSGESVSLVGASGCGKSSLLHIAGLLDSYQQGTIIIDSQNMNNIGEDKKTKIRLEKIGFIYQLHNLLPEFCAWENVAYPMWVSGIGRSDAKKKAINLLESVGLQDKIYSLATKLSGGEAQRVAIARSLANNPKIILADEPTGNLDDENTQNVWALLLDLVKKQNVSLLCVTHDMNLAKKTDNIYSLKNKKIVKINK